jgi:hypothetical protein
MSRRDAVNLVLRVTMEGGIVAALAWWGVATGGNPGTKILYGIGAPVLGFAFWGTVDFHQLGRRGEAARLIQELAVSALAATAWFAAGQRGLGIGLAALSGAYHGLVYATGARLLNPRADAPVRQEAASAEGGVR